MWCLRGIEAMFSLLFLLIKYYVARRRPGSKLSNHRKQLGNISRVIQQSRDSLGRTKNSAREKAGQEAARTTTS